MIVALREPLPEGATVAQRIVRGIIVDLSFRYGLNTEWESIDSRWQRDIEAEWVRIAQAHLDQGVANAAGPAGATASQDKC